VALFLYASGKGSGLYVYSKDGGLLLLKAAT